MDCPRCGDTLTAYALGDSRAQVCESCGYADVPAEHRGEPTDPESWAEAIERAEAGELPEPRADAVGEPPAVPAADDGTETPTVEELGSVAVGAALDGRDDGAGAEAGPAGEGDADGEAESTDEDADSGGHGTGGPDPSDGDDDSDADGPAGSGPGDEDPEPDDDRETEESGEESAGAGGDGSEGAEGSG